ncbi:MAG: ORF6N domain-containing protein [Deltaproteobacteria bacterium]|nr:ORF6N domain-containing protein [Deltaproteobacteria bacterium]
MGEASLSTKEISHRIYFIRGHRVMLDSDLATLYGVETRAINQAVRRNAKRFPADFMFQLTDAEHESLRSQIVILKTGRGQHRKYLPLAFTEQGVAMLSSVLNSERAVQVNIAIMRTFVKIREMLETHKELAKRLDQLERKYDRRFKAVFEAIRQLMSVGSPLPQKRIKGLSDD